MLSKKWVIISALGILLLVLSCGAPPSDGSASNLVPPTAMPDLPLPTMSSDAPVSDALISDAPVPTATPDLPLPTMSSDAPIPAGQSNAPQPYAEYKPPFLPIKFIIDSSGISV